MDYHDKWFLAYFLLLHFLIQSGCSGSSSAAELPNSTLTKDVHRRNKQFLLPVVVLPAFPLGILVSDEQSFKFQRLHEDALRHHHQPAVIRIENPGNLVNSFSHAIEERKDISCKTESSTLGICKPLMECFPMVQVEYGNDVNMTEDSIMDIPFVEQLFRNTKSNLCSQSEMHDGKPFVCCPEPSAVHVGKSKLELHYANHAFSTPVHAVITQRPPLRRKFLLSRQLNTPVCGQSSSNYPAYQDQPGLKITGGQEARGPLEFPWMVAVFGKNKKVFCGASLITHQFLLSAAHCFSTFTEKDVGDIFVHLGDFNIKTVNDGPHEVRRIEKIILNKGFKIEHFHNDIVLLKLDKPVNFTDRIHPICLPQPTMSGLEKQNIIVTGWGRKFRYASTSDVLRKVEIPIWNLDQCKQIFSTFAPGRIMDNNICAGDGKRNKDACLGDSGGPAVLFDGEKWVQVGITSWGKGCGSFPGVYTRVDKHLMWITKNLNRFA